MNVPKLVSELEDFLTRGESDSHIALIQTNRHDATPFDNLISLHSFKNAKSVRSCGALHITYVP
jgi:hypothetical protein